MSNQTKESKNQLRSLISVSPKLYRYITSELEKRYHIHSYDLQAGAIKKDDGVHIFLRYGEHYNNEKDQFLTNEMLEDGKVLETFVEEVGEACKQVMIDDYFNKMTP
ncbi:hypothetical protein [Oceanobacillus sp. Castelsardo]|uniref:hypothetical protein n=1 Tax=Oceanobacillus sp. Castelsardo TaxID=1851204 RepID=UPI0008384B9E|nr:hypothetical protein [Oceanobacillus sp. Castelsardo]